MIIIKRILGPRVMIKKIEEEEKLESGIVIQDDFKKLPRGEVVMISDEVKELISVGDKVYYLTPRQEGKCKHKGETRYIMNIGDMVSIYKESK